MDNIFAMQIQATGIQALESAYIIGTSKNIDVIMRRYLLLLEKIEVLKQGHSSSQYTPAIQMALDSYKRLYYDRTLQDYQASILSKPNNFNLTEFYCTSLVDATKRFHTAENEEINAMKRENTKAKRKAKVIEGIQLAIEELQNKCSSASSFSKASIELENLKNTSV